MSETRIQISSIVEGQLPEFVREEFPLVGEFLNQYYLSLENQGGTTDILQNIDQYVKVDNLTNLIDSTTLSADILSFDSTINVESTAGFPKKYGLLQIDDEIISYTGITTNSFIGCIRGFSGVTSYQSKNIQDQLVFTESNSNDHSFGSTVQNLSILFLKEFFKKIKKQISPGFEDRELYSDLNERIFIKQSRDFYTTKGTNTSFEILFRALYGEDVEVIKPRDFLIQPSDAQYDISKNLVVEAISGNPLDLENTTLYQDNTEFINKARGTIVHVEKILRGNKEYYVLNLDYNPARDINLIGTVVGEFSIHPKTKLVTSVSVGSTVLDVDSTIGFPESGTLVASLSNGSEVSITYDSKTINQFFNCSGVDQPISLTQELALDAYAYGYVGIGTSNVVKVRVTGVLSDLEINPNNQYYSKGDLVKIRTLGKDLSDYKSNNWFFNVSTSFDVFKIELSDSLSNTYTVHFYDNHNFFVGDSVTLISSTGEEKTGDVILINDNNSFTIRGQGALNTNLYYTARKNILKVNSQNYPELKIYSTNVQNVYTDSENSLYVASPSLPSYLKESLDINDRSVTFSGTFDSSVFGTEFNFGFSHGFYTGDAVVYIGDLIPNGVYFVKVIDENTIKIARSRANIDTETFISVSGNITNGKFIFEIFCFRDLTPQSLEPQKLVRKISEPENDTTTYETHPGETGIFINGVELLNYKSRDNIYYGSIEEIISTSPGSGYDIINPPILTISDPTGVGASAYCSVLGGLERIDIIDPGFDYLEEPVITISGGNGFNAVAKTKLISFDHSVEFNSQINAGLVNLTNNTIGFSTYHKFRDCEEVIYFTNGGSAVVGLTTNSNYFVSVQDEYNIKLHKSLSDANAQINSIDLTGYGTKNHILKSKNKKKKIGSIVIENSGQNYQNKKTTVTNVGIDTASDIINIKNHGYLSGELIHYTSSGTSINGLTNATDYYVTVVNENQFKLSKVGLSTDTELKDFYYRTKQYIDLISGGSGVHTFNYPEIKVNISGRIGVSTLTNQNFNAVLQPIFRGKINSVFIENGGSSYGSQDILNYIKQPEILLNSGSGAQVTPIISNGQIVDVIVNSVGYSYNSPPNLIIDGDGQGAILTPILLNGTLISVKVIFGGVGYTQSKTSISVTSAGKDAVFYSKLKSWKINLIERLIQTRKITRDDGILDSGIVNKLGLEYTHGYAPRSLRKLVSSKKLDNGVIIYSPDLQFTTSEQNSTSHSPIIGWAYDGNPIYGPYGYDNPRTGGNVRLMKSGYSQILLPNRPSGYPIGFFVEDYQYKNIGDLDEFNGRFCVTPDYPNGVYAYFCTLGSLGSSGSPFENYRTPVFPYVIGNFYKSKPIEFNYLKSSNQDNFNFKDYKLLRNTTPYNLIKKKSRYDFILNPNKIQEQLTEIKHTTTGSIQSIGIVTGGKNYKVNDLVIFNTKDSGGRNARAKVSLVEGKNVSQISVASSTVSNVEFIPIDNLGNFIGFSTQPHNFIDNDQVKITTKYENNKVSKVVVESNKFNLRSGVGSATYTGIVTYFNISGSLKYPNIRENDIYQINSEQIKVLNIDTLNSRIRVLRNYNGTTGLTTYLPGIGLTEKTRKLKLNFGISSTSYEYSLNRQLYFDPKESLGIGLSSGVGIVSTLYFSNPASGITSITIPTQSIYLPNHQLNTGDSLLYSSNGGTTISISTDGSSLSQLSNNSILYVAKLSNDLIGISTLRVGLGSTGSFVGIGTTSANILYFNNFGTGVYHSFTTQYEDNLVGQVSKNVVTVSTASTHGLSVGDSVIVDVKSGISTTIVIKYNDYNRRLIANPRPFAGTDINLLDNTIYINNHGYIQGQKIIHTSTSPSGGLVDEGIYYIVVIDSNRIKLSETLYSSKKSIPDVVDITSTSFGTISPINPPLNIFKNQTTIFDLSDLSLSVTVGVQTRSAFDLNFYIDSKFKNKFDSSSSTPFFEVSKYGIVGVTSDAKVILNLTDSIPKVLYYKLDPINLQNNTSIKTEIVVDNEQINFNQLNFIDSIYNGTHSIIAISTSGFNYNLINYPEKNNYSYDSSKLQYYTNSYSAEGPIHAIKVISKGNDFSNVIQISNVKTDSGYDSLLSAYGVGIGSVINKEILDIGFDYSTDYTIRPTGRLPTIVKIDPFYSFESVGIVSLGRDYNINPKLIVLDGLTNKVVNDVVLDYQPEKFKVEILSNTKKLNNVTPKIIPINNTNGVGISSVSFDFITKNVTVTLNVGYSTESSFPFIVGDKVLIENVSVGIGSTNRGYNSEEYGYQLFTLTSIDKNIGGENGSVTYNMSEYLEVGETLGSYDDINSAGRIIPERYFPKFISVIIPNDFYNGEIIQTFDLNQSGICQKENENDEYLKIITSDIFNIGDLVKGSTSFTEGKIVEILSSSECVYDVNSSSVVKNGWKRETGFLSNDLQRIHDSDYYQYFSYALKSKITFDTWKIPVSDLNHVSGFKKFSDLMIESLSYTGLSTSQTNGDFTTIVDISEFIDLNCVNDFDLVRELLININNTIKSNQIVFNSATLQDYIESIGNRVLTIDDMSGTFNSNPRLTKYSIIDTFLLSSARSKKYFIYVIDSRYIAERQISVVTLLHNNFYGFLNQYGTVPTSYDMGYFDFIISGDEGKLLYYPEKYEYNNFNTSFVSYDMQDSLSGIGTIILGDVVRVGSSTTSLPSGTNTAFTIVGINSTYRSSKVLVQIGATNGSYYEYDELTIIHDGTTANFLDYGQLTTNTLSPISSSGIGTYSVYFSGSDLNIDLIPNSALSVQHNINTIQVSISNTSSIGIGTTTINNSELSSNYVAISSSSSPVSTVISSYDNQIYSCAYCLISIEDLTNNSYKVSEILISDNKNNAVGFASTTAYVTEFGIIETNNSLGIISADVSGTNTILYFTPIPDIDVQVRVFQHSLGLIDIDITETFINF